MITASVLTVLVWGESLSLLLTIKTLVLVLTQLHMYCTNHFECFSFSVLPNDPLLLAAETKTSVKGMRHTFTLSSFAKFFPF